MDILNYPMGSQRPHWTWLEGIASGEVLPNPMDSVATGANTMPGELSEHKPRPGLFQREFSLHAPRPLAPKSKLKLGKEGSLFLQTICFDSSLNDAKTDLLFPAAQKQKPSFTGLWKDTPQSLTSAVNWNKSIHPYLWGSVLRRERLFIFHIWSLCFIC